MTTQLLRGDWRIEGDLTIGGDLKPARPRSELLQDSAAIYLIPWCDWRIWDAVASLLPAAGTADDLGLIGGTFGTGVPSIQTGDVKNLGAVTRYARCQVRLPPEYVAGETVTVRLHAGMLTTIASVSATIGVQAYLSGREAVIDGSDLCETAAITINSLTLADKDFTLTPTSLAPGDLIDIRVAIATNDSATATAVIGVIGSAELLLDIKG